MDEYWTLVKKKKKNKQKTKTNDHLMNINHLSQHSFGLYLKQ